jgi:hypothetical protein
VDADVTTVLPDGVLATDTPVGRTLEALATCLCAQILADGTPQTCFCGVLPGAEFPIKMANCRNDNQNGIAWVRLINTYPSVSVGQAYIEPNNCAVSTGLDIEIGIFRCYPLTRDGANPPPEVMLEAARLAYADERTMRRAISCCGWAEPQDFVVGTYIPQGPAGGLLGGAIPLSVMIQ